MGVKKSKKRWAPQTSDECSGAKEGCGEEGSGAQEEDPPAEWGVGPDSSCGNQAIRQTRGRLVVNVANHHPLGDGRRHSLLRLCESYGGH